ncbi:hypothetical protein ACQKCH_14920 [Nubsella zeaxanthinifaciens]|uniref:hypothetical protein n=1 Tax=Nubsella zeaxanthinifaciens TaxID=392412 RepID=UPI003D0302D8
MQKFTLDLKKFVFLGFGLALLVSSGFIFPEDSRVFIHELLNKYYDKDGQQEPLKRYELNVTNTGFCRYRKIYASGKEEFFSFNLSRFKSMDYYGDTKSGQLWLHTKNDDVIVQTRKDKNGDIDSMATYLVIPLKSIDEEKLNELADRFRQLSQIQLSVNK